MTVVHVDQYHTHYIGRPGPFGNPWSHKRSAFATSFAPTVQEAIQRFEQYAKSNLDLLLLIADLPEDAVLGCWCKKKGHEPCHGDVIVKLWKEIHGKS